MKMQHIITALLALASATGAANPPAPCGAVPTERQIQWQRMEWYGFVHFGITTYLDYKQWGYGNDDPSLFNPSNFDADKIVKLFKDAGMTGMIYTVKHHDGFCLWPTSSTKFNITLSPWKEGKGDVAREFAEACKRHGLKFGVYISPWDRNCAEYGRPGYRPVFHKQIEEMLAGYGDIFEIWFDGCMGGDGYYGGSCETRSIGDSNTYYGFARVEEIVRSHQPNCILWGAGEHGDCTWGGSEQGFVTYPYWNVTNGKGDMDGRFARNLPDIPAPEERWLPFEADTSIFGKKWFWDIHISKELRSPKALMDEVYMKSVGRGANLILNIPINRDGEVDTMAQESLLQFGDIRRKLLSTDCALDAEGTASNVRGNDTKNFGPEKLTDGDIESYWCTDDQVTTGEVVLELEDTATFDVVRVREQIRLGQRVQNFAVDAWVDGKWVTIDAEEPNGKSIGNQVMRRVAPTTTDKVRLRITKSRACPCISELSLLNTSGTATDFSPLKKLWLQFLSHRTIRRTSIAGGILLVLLLILRAVVAHRRRRNNVSKEQA